MARYLFVAPPFVAHILPMVAVSREMRGRGHDIAWVLHASVRHLLDDDEEVYEVPETLPEEAIADLRTRAGGRWLPALKVFWQDIVVPLAWSMLPGVSNAVRDFRPDIVFTDQQALSGALAALKCDLPWATSSATALPFSGFLEAFPQIRHWMTEVLTSLQTNLSLPPVDALDSSPELVILYTTREFAGDAILFPEHFLFVGPVHEQAADNTSFPWEELRPVPRLYITLGTVSSHQGESFFRTALSALGDTGCQLIIAGPPRLAEEAPAGTIVQPWVPQARLLREVQGVISHAGFRTTIDVLANGLPSVVAPVAFDNFQVAQMIVSASAGVRIRFHRLTAHELRGAVIDILEKPVYRQSAQRLQDSFRRAGGVAAAADALETLKARVD